MNARQAQILDLVTEGYIRSAHPVPSSWVAKRLEVSSATVRNEFSALEEAGYLQQPHTSAGRVPTALGYTRYARKFIPPRRLPPAQRQQLEARLKGVHGDTLLQQLAAVTAELSGYAVVVTLPADDALIARNVHLSALSSSRLLAVVVLESGLVRQLALELEPMPSDAVLQEAESSLHQLGLPVREVPQALVDLAKRTRRDLARTLRALAQAWPHLQAPKVFAQGLTNLLAEPESANPEFVRRAVAKLEAPDVGQTEEALAIVFEELLAQVRVALRWGGTRGALVLLGPARMRYPEVLMIAGAVGDTLSTEFGTSEEQLN